MEISEAFVNQDESLPLVLHNLDTERYVFFFKEIFEVKGETSIRKNIRNIRQLVFSRLRVQFRPFRSSFWRETWGQQKEDKLGQQYYTLFTLRPAIFFEALEK